MSSDGRSSQVWYLSLNEPRKPGREIPTEFQWSGRSDTWPSAAELGHILKPSSLTEEQLVNLTSQIIAGAPVQSLGTLLSCLVCSYCRLPDASVADSDPDKSPIDTRVLQSLSQAAKTARRPVCGVVFKKGDIVWYVRRTVFFHIS